jgi:hypothetical protein
MINCKIEYGVLRVGIKLFFESTPKSQYSFLLSSIGKYECVRKKSFSAVSSLTAAQAQHDTAETTPRSDAEDAGR